MSSEIIEFYRDKSIFVTGATGFLGKALIEKLLRSCYHLKRIYVLVREKKGKSIDKRLEEIYNNKLFDQVRELHPNFTEKLVAIRGDLQEPNLGISDNDRQILSDNVNIVFHSAATVRFDEPIKVAVAMNISGVNKVIDLCESLKNLTVFIHVSTAYANCDRSQIDEIVYEPSIDPKKLLEVVEYLDDNLLDHLTPKLIKDKPNTYTYTKALAESLLIDRCKNMPCAIVRPSIVGATWKEPFSGWIDNFNGPTALFPATGTGLLRTMFGKHDAIADIIPVDIPVNLMIASAWYTGTKRSDKILVYNCTSGQINKFTWGMLEEYGIKAFFKNPFENIFIYPDPHFTMSRTVKLFRTLFEQLIPAYTADLIYKILGKKPIFIKLQNKIKLAVAILEYFTTRSWVFSNKNLFMLMDNMSNIDRKGFNLSINDLNWSDYIESYCLGAKVYLMKEDVSRIDQCRNKIKRMKYLNYFLLFGLGILIFSVFISFWF